MIEVVTIILALLAAFFMLVAGLGILRMPDLFLRMSASTKASTLGITFALAAAAVYFQDFGVATRCFVAILFMLATAPVGAHMIGRAGYLSGARLWEHTLNDELAGRYDRERHTLASPPRAEDERKETE